MYRSILSVSKYTTRIRVFSSQATDESGRCITQFLKEHVRIKATLKSFQTMLNSMKIEDNDFVPIQQANDIKRYIEFVSNYQWHHHQKEEIVYGKLINHEDSNDIVVALTESIQDEHIDEYNSIKRMQKVSQLLDSCQDTKINVKSEVIDPSLTFIDLMENHIFEEEKDVYPMIKSKFTETEMGEIDNILDEYDANNAQIVCTMEELSDELQNLY
eukprot:298050_1